MTGITACATYVPRHRLARETIAAAWGKTAIPGCKAVAGFDEDALTMAHAALSRLGGAPPERVYFASTTSPFWQRSVAAQIAAACDFPPVTATADFGGSLRAGTSALRAALEAGVNAAVVAADQRDGEPESAQEILFGDAAAAIAVGSDNLIAEFIAAASRSDDLLDEWRRDNDAYVRGFPGKFSQTRGYLANVTAVVRAVLERAGVKPSEIARAILPSPDGSAHIAAARALGLTAEDPRAGDIGVTGTPQPLLMLAHALGRARAGDLILVASYGDGADAMLFRATRDAESGLPSEPAPLAIPSYAMYRKLREEYRIARGGPDISNVLQHREERQNVRLHATYCPKCSAVQFPISPVCERCRNRQGLEEKPLARTGTIFSFNKDFLYDAPVQPTINAIVECAGGGRILCQMTDTDPAEVRIGMNVELVLRRMRDGESVRHYYWKCRPR